MIYIQVLGRPQPAGSKRAFVNRRTGGVIVADDAKKSRPWKQQVAESAAAALQEQGVDGLLDGPLRLDVTFFLARPKGHFRTGRNAHLLRDSAPRYPAVKPDATKLLRAVEDALSGIAYRDDAQVVHQVVTKRYDVPERVEIHVARFDS